MKQQPLFVALLGAAFFVASGAHAEEEEVHHYGSLLGTFTLTDEDRVPQQQGDKGYGVRALYGRQYPSRWGWGVALETQVIETDIPSFTDFYRHSLELHGTYALGDREGFTPYALLGVGANYNDDRDTGFSDGVDPYGTAGLGFVTAPLIQRGQVKLRGELRYIYDDFGDGYSDYQAALGIELPLFKKPEPVEPPPAPEPEVRVVEAELEDSDGDGIPDKYDKCPGTPPGTRVDAHGCALQDTLNLHGVLFAFDSADLHKNARRVLLPVVELFTRYPDLEIEVAGHTDSVGPAEYNQKLSQRRAEAVRQFLIDRGVPAGQVRAEGYGENEPVASNDTPEGREDNRRVEIRILN